MALISKIRTFLAIILAHIVHTLAYLFPRDKKLWVFMGWHHNGKREVFADNSKYMFLHAAQLQHVRAIWIAQDQQLAKLLRSHGYEAHSQFSIRGIYFSLRAGVTVIDAFFSRTNWQFSSGSTVVQLWHGKGFKKVGYASPTSLALHNKLISPQLFTKYDYTIASSGYTADMMSEVLHISKDRVLITGLPRNDVLFKEIEGSKIDANPELKKLFGSDNKPSGGYILYAPTFRRSGDNPADHLDFDLAQKHLEKNGAQLVISLHPKYRDKIPATRSHSRITFIPAGYDIYPHLKYFDTLITDYSSLFLEFVLLDKHVVFFTYDLEDYKNTTGLYDDYDKLTPGPHTNATEELLKKLGTKSDWAEKRKETRSLLFDHEDGSSSNRVAENVSQKLNLRGGSNK
jgi:CDP-glycerol glycerophosphotransferase (TagB/SpsB family)